MSLKTGRLLSRSFFTPVPMTDAVIARVHTIAKTQKNTAPGLLFGDRHNLIDSEITGVCQEEENVNDQEEENGNDQEDYQDSNEDCDSDDDDDPPLLEDACESDSDSDDEEDEEDFSKKENPETNNIKNPIKDDSNIKSENDHQNDPVTSPKVTRSGRKHTTTTKLHSQCGRK